MLIELPVELIYQLLSYLDYNELFNLRKTCKKLKTLISSKNIGKLIVFVQNYPYENDLFYLNEPIGRTNSLRIENLKTFRSINFKNTFKHIKKFAIYHDDNKEYQAHYEENEKLKSLSINLDKDVNCFEELIHLEISQVGKLTGCLKLKNLRRCLMNTREISKIRIDCENLTTLCLMNGIQPEMISDKLEYLKFENIELGFLNEFFKYHKLTTICLSLITDFFKNLNFIRRTLSTSKETNLFYQSIKIDSEQLLEDLIETFHFLEGKESVIFLSNQNQETCFDRLLPHMIRIELNQNNEIDRQLIYRFKSLKFVKIENQILNETLFFSILRNWKKLKEFTLVSIKLSQASFDLMPNYFQNLRILIIRNCKVDNLDFIVQFKNLTKIGISKINFKLKKQKLRYLLDNSLNLKSFQILDHQKNIAILIDKQINRYTYKEKNIRTLNFYCLHSLIDFLYLNL